MPPQRRLNVHFQSDPKAPHVFHMTWERYRNAERRHPHIARRLRPTIATDCEGFYEAIGEADVLVGWWFPCDEFAEYRATLEVDSHHRRGRRAPLAARMAS